MDSIRILIVLITFALCYDFLKDSDLNKNFEFFKKIGISERV